MSSPHFYSILGTSGYVGTFSSKEDAEHARLRLFGVRALAHPIVRVLGVPRASWNAAETPAEGGGEG